MSYVTATPATMSGVACVKEIPTFQDTNVWKAIEEGCQGEPRPAPLRLPVHRPNGDDPEVRLSPQIPLPRPQATAHMLVLRSRRSGDAAGRRRHGNPARVGAADTL